MEQGKLKLMPAALFLWASVAERLPPGVNTGAQPKMRGKLNQGPKPKADVRPKLIKLP